MILRVVGEMGNHTVILCTPCQEHFDLGPTMESLSNSFFVFIQYLGDFIKEHGNHPLVYTDEGYDDSDDGWKQSRFSLEFWQIEDLENDTDWLGKNPDSPQYGNAYCWYCEGGHCIYHGAAPLHPAAEIWANKLRIVGE